MSIFDDPVQIFKEGCKELEIEAIKTELKKKHKETIQEIQSSVGTSGWWYSFYDVDE